METVNTPQISPEMYVDQLFRVLGSPDIGDGNEAAAIRQFAVEMTREAMQKGNFDYKGAGTLFAMPDGFRKDWWEEPETVNIAPKAPYSMLATHRPAEEIRQDIHVMTTFLACSELLFASEMYRYSYRIQKMLEDKGLYRHQLKKYANKLREVTDLMMMRSNDTDRHVTLKQCAVITPCLSYGRDFYDEGGGLLNRMSMAFHRDFELKFKRIQLDNMWIAKEMKAKHPDLLAEIFTLTSLAQCDIELFESVQKKLDNLTRGRLRSKSCIKSTHSEAIRNAARNLADHFVNRMDIMPEDATRMMRKHLTEFQYDITCEAQFEFFNGQFLALKMDYIEYYLARVRMEMEHGRLSVAQVRNLWYRLGKKHVVKQMLAELKSIRLPKKELEVCEFSRKIATAKGDHKAMNSFRRLCVEDQCIKPDREPDEVWQCRVLRILARKHQGMLPDDVIRSMVEAHGTKKAVVERLTKAGFELQPTIRRVKKMKLAELKQLGR